MASIRHPVLRRAASNVMLGLALGLLSYYALTSLLTELAQRDLQGDNADVATFAEENPLERLKPSSADGILDFDSWESEDQKYWSELPEGEVFGRIIMDDIGVDALVVKGVQPQDLRRGPGWIDYSNVPGPTGNCGISGHRTTFGAPFRRVDELMPGDLIDFYSPYRRYRYEVTRTLIVRPDQVEVVAFTESPMLTLTACHPPFSARSRIIVQADLVEVRRIEAETD